MKVWRLGHHKNPCDFTPHHIYAWNHRFDDSERAYRTIYAADQKETCLREVLVDFIPNPKALAEFKEFMGVDAELSAAVGTVKQEWRQENVLTRATVVLESGTLADIEEASVMRGIGIAGLNAEQLRSKDRGVTHRASRALFDKGHAGVEFHSHIDSNPCYALFEGRAHLDQVTPSHSLKDDLPELEKVCKEFGLRLE